jgi:hypothetical protein
VETGTNIAPHPQTRTQANNAKENRRRRRFLVSLLFHETRPKQSQRDEHHPHAATRLARNSTRDKNRNLTRSAGFSGKRFPPSDSGSK